MKTDGLSRAELRARVEQGWRCVRYVWCVSNVITTVERRSRVHLTENWQDRYLRGFGYSMLSILIGPWGVPWGLWRTAESVITNLTGGIDVTEEDLVHHRDAGSTEKKSETG